MLLWGVVGSDRGAGVQVSAPTRHDTIVDELLEEYDEADENAHLACGCRPHIMMCGIYIPSVSGVTLIPTDEPVCPGCSRLWFAIGCPACSCGPGAICMACVASTLQGG